MNDGIRFHSTTRLLSHCGKAWKESRRGYRVVNRRWARWSRAQMLQECRTNAEPASLTCGNAPPALLRSPIGCHGGILLQADRPLHHFFRDRNGASAQRPGCASGGDGRHAGEVRQRDRSAARHSIAMEGGEALPLPSQRRRITELLQVFLNDLISCVPNRPRKPPTRAHPTRVAGFAASPGESSFRWHPATTGRGTCHCWQRRWWMRWPLATFRPKLVLCIPRKATSEISVIHAKRIR